MKRATITIDVHNEHGIVCFENLLMELFRRFEVEANAKNKAYSFILRGKRAVTRPAQHRALVSDLSDGHSSC